MNDESVTKVEKKFPPWQVLLNAVQDRNLWKEPSTHQGRIGQLAESSRRLLEQSATRKKLKYMNDLLKWPKDYLEITATTYLRQRWESKETFKFRTGKIIRGNKISSYFRWNGSESSFKLNFDEIPGDNGDAAGSQKWPDDGGKIHWEKEAEQICTHYVELSAQSV